VRWTFDATVMARRAAQASLEADKAMVESAVASIKSDRARLAQEVLDLARG